MIEYSKELFDSVCARLAEGDSLRKISKTKGMPKPSTFVGWCNNSADLAEQYARARDMGLDCWADECLEIADDDSKDFGFKEVTDESGQSAQVFINKDNIQRAKLRIDERHWQMSKQRPKKWGDFTRNETDLNVKGSLIIQATPMDEKL